MGDTFDPLLNFNQHATKVKSKFQARYNALKALAGSTCGKEKETLPNTYKMPMANYAAPIFAQQLFATNWQAVHPKTRQ